MTIPPGVNCRRAGFWGLSVEGRFVVCATSGLLVPSSKLAFGGLESVHMCFDLFVSVIPITISFGALFALALVSRSVGWQSGSLSGEMVGKSAAGRVGAGLLSL